MRHQKESPTLEDYKALDLENLELDHLNLEAESSFSIGRWLILIGLIGLVGFVVWFPNSDAYRMSPHGQTYFFALSSLAIIVGIVGGRWLWAWLEESAERYAMQASAHPVKPPRVISPLERWLTLVGATIGLITVAILSNDYSGIPGQGPSEHWWSISLGSILSACLGGRWLIIHSNRPQQKASDSPPAELPKWFKWVTFTILALAGLFAVFGSSLMGNGPSIFDSSTFGAVGLLVGTFGAIWLAKRFDELETHFKDTKKHK